MLDAKLRASLETDLCSLQRDVDVLAGENRVLESVVRQNDERIDDMRLRIRAMQSRLMEA